MLSLALGSSSHVYMACCCGPRVISSPSYRDLGSEGVGGFGCVIACRLAHLHEAWT